MSASIVTPQIHVITHVDNQVSELNKQEVINIFMGSVNQYQLDAVALKPSNDARVKFNTLVIGLTESRIQSYWAQMRFSGKLSQPEEAQSEAVAIDIVQNDTNKITYVSATTELPENVKIIYSN